MKYIVNTGCSYGVMFRSFKSFVESDNNNFRIIDLHCDSHGAEYQKRSVVFAVSKLLDTGVLPSDIFVITEWSQPNRLFTELPQELSKNILSKKNEFEPSFYIDHTFNHVDNSEPFVLKYKSLCTIFGDRAYINPDVDDTSYLEEDMLDLYIKQYKENSVLNNKPIDRFENYLQNIVSLQDFLKSRNIDYVFFLMNNTLSGYDDNFSHEYFTNEFENIIKQDNISLPKLTFLNQIKDFSTYLQTLWNLLDLNKFVFYTTENIQFGGIDEYAMEKFGHISYYSAMNEWDKTDKTNIAYFGSHPHDSIYIDFFKEYIYKKVHHITGNLQFTMNDRWSPTKHNAIRL